MRDGEGFYFKCYGKFCSIINLLIPEASFLTPRWESAQRADGGKSALSQALPHPFMGEMSLATEGAGRVNFFLSLKPPFIR
jgi:hypothetical protein